MLRSRQRHLAPSILAGALLLGASPVHADDLADRPPTWDMDIDELRAVGLGQSRGDPVVPPVDLDAPTRPLAAKQGVIFVSFDAMTLGSGESSIDNLSMIYQGEVAEYGGGATERAALMEAVRIDWAPYNILVVDQRPSSGDYTMNVTTPTNPFGGGVLGIAPLDCLDMMTHNNVTFAFHSANDGFSAATQATTVGQEVAHSYGLEHVDEPADIMNPTNVGGDPSFVDECLPIVGGSVCGAQHEAQCGDMASQNSHKELLDLFGPSEPDTMAPTVTIVAPVDNAMFLAGANFSITVEAADDNALSEIQLFNGESALQTDISEPYGWEIAGIPAGMYVFKVVATDLSGNTAESNVVNVYVGVPPDPDTGGESEGSAEGEETGEDEDSDTEPGMNEGRGAEGCGCTQASGRGSALVLAFAAFGVVRRRRRHARSA